MAFSDDGGGFAFNCDDAKLSICASTWKTRLSQIEQLSGPIFVMTGLLPDIQYISEIVGKRPNDFYIIANTSAVADAKYLKNLFPVLHIALHPKTNAKVVMVSPETVWVSSSDFGKTSTIESAVGMHSSNVFSKTLDLLFKRVWNESTVIN